MDSKALVTIMPTLSLDGLVFIKPIGNVAIKSVKAWDAAGRVVWEKKGGEPVKLPEQRGVYIILVETNRWNISENGSAAGEGNESK